MFAAYSISLSASPQFHCPTISTSSARNERSRLAFQYILTNPSFVALVSCALRDYKIWGSVVGRDGPEKGRRGIGDYQPCTEWTSCGYSHSPYESTDPARSLTSDRIVHTIMKAPNQRPPGSRRNPTIAVRRDMLFSRLVMAARGTCFLVARLR